MEIGDADYDKERSAGIDAENAWVSNRISGNGLHKCAGDAKCTSGENSKDCSGNPGKHYLCLKGSGFFSKKGIYYSRKEDKAAPKAQRENDAGQEKEYGQSGQNCSFSLFHDGTVIERSELLHREGQGIRR